MRKVVKDNVPLPRNLKHSLFIKTKVCRVVKARFFPSESAVLSPLTVRRSAYLNAGNDHACDQIKQNVAKCIASAL